MSWICYFFMTCLVLYIGFWLFLGGLIGIWIWVSVECVLFYLTSMVIVFICKRNTGHERFGLLMFVQLLTGFLDGWILD
jgi:hypothetical protein